MRCSGCVWPSRCNLAVQAKQVLYTTKPSNHCRTVKSSGTVDRNIKKGSFRQREWHTLLAASLKVGLEMGIQNGEVGVTQFIFRQMFEKDSSTYTYLLADAVTREAVLIDPVRETVSDSFHFFCRQDPWGVGEDYLANAIWLVVPKC
jgi:hypothetical protein